MPCNSTNRPQTTDSHSQENIDKRTIRITETSVKVEQLQCNLTMNTGKNMIFADHLSRNIGTKESKEQTCSGLDLKINDIYLNASEERCISLVQETEKDELLVALKNQIIKGWHDNRCDCPVFLRDFWSYRDELSILDSLVLKRTRIIVPKSCQEELLKKLHDGHFGVECTKLHTRDSLYWLHINRDIEDLVKSCEKCQEFSRRNSKDPVLPRELPLVTWTLLELDLFTCKNAIFLLIVDVTSQFPVVRNLPSESTRSVLNALKGVYCDFGLPKRVLTDNGPSI